MKEYPKEIKIQWHAYFAQVMEKICTRKDFLVEREKEVAKMPLKIDFIVIKKQDIQYKNLTKPYLYFNDINVIEFKSKTDCFDWDSLYQLEVYGKLYGINKQIEERNKISLWSVSSHFTEKYRKSLEQGGILLEKLDDGFHRGMAGGFPYYEINLVEIPFTKEYYPFHLFSKKEENVRKLIEKFIDEPSETEDYNIEMLYLYNRMYREVLIMKLLDPFEAGCDEEGLKELLFGEPFGGRLINKYEDEIINKIGEDEIINKIGRDKFINKIGEDEVTKALLNRLGKEKLLQLLDRLDRET
jgi:hypothetical protein